jgi:hypothetical protein
VLCSPLGKLVPSHSFLTLTAVSQLAPIWVCTTNDALDAVVASVPRQHHPDLILVQNGMLQPWLHSQQLKPTQVLLYMGGELPVHGSPCQPASY